MARTPDPHSASAQFFINVVDNAMLDHPNSQGEGYAVFGEVIEGMEIADKIVAVPTFETPLLAENNGRWIVSSSKASDAQLLINNSSSCSGSSFLSAFF